MTSGPTVPDSTGKVTRRRAVGEVERGGTVGHCDSSRTSEDHAGPAGGTCPCGVDSSCAAAAMTLMRCAVGRAAGRPRDRRARARPDDQVPQIVVGEVEQAVEQRHLLLGHLRRRAPRGSATARGRSPACRAGSASGCGSAAPGSARDRRRERGSRTVTVGTDVHEIASGVGHPRESPPSDRPLHHDFLDLADRQRRIEALRAHVDAIHDRVAAEQPVRVLEVVEPLARWPGRGCRR